MYHEDIIIPNFERVEAAILGLQDDVGHVLLTDRNLGRQESFLGKVYLTVQDLGKYCPSVKRHYAKVMSDKHRHHNIQDASEMSDTSAHDTADEDDDSESLSDEESPLDLSEFMDEDDAPEPPFQELLQAIVGWVKDQVIAATNDLPVRAFLLRAYSPKGSRVLMTSTFRAENRAWRPPSARLTPAPPHELPMTGRSAEPVSRVEAGAGASHASASAMGASHASASGTGAGSLLLPVNQAAVPSAPPNLMSGGFQPPAGMVLLPANVADGGLYGTVGAFRALGDSYEQYGRIMVNGVEQLQGMMNQVLGDMGRELHGARGQVTSLVDHVLEKRVREVEIREEHAENIQQTDMKMTLAREAVGQLGHVAQSFFTARGIPPELAEVLGALSSSPELVATLQKPSVRALLQNPDNLKALATSLESIGEQQEQVRSVMQGARTSQPPPAGYPGLPTGYGAPSLLATPGGAGVSGHAPGAGANPPQASWMPVPPPYPPPYPNQAPTPGNPYPAQAGGFPTQAGFSPAQTGAYPTQPGMYPAQPGPYQGQPGPYPTPSGAYPALPGASSGWQAGAHHTHRGPSQPVQFPQASVPQPGFPQPFVDGYGRPAYGQAPPVARHPQSMSSAPEPPGLPTDPSGPPRSEPDRPQ